MSRATKGEVAELARRVLGLGSSVAARRRFTTFWCVEVRDPADVISITAEEPSLGAAYHAVAVQLRARGADAV